jgi:hypothetical protein
MNMSLVKKAGITDPFKTEFTPNVWTKTGKLLPGIRKYLLRFIEKTLGYPVSVFAVVNMIGSTLTYQYSESSDIDLSLGLKPEYDHLLPELHLKCKEAMDNHILPGTQHPINLFVSPSMRKLRTESLSGGYDLMAQRWIKVPNKPTVSDKRRFDMIKPYLNLQRNELKRQMVQVAARPNSMNEVVDVANQFGRLDKDRKIAYDFPTPAGGNTSNQNATFKYSLKGQNYGLIDRLYNKLKKTGLTFYKD